MDAGALEKLLESGPDSAMLRLSLAGAWFEAGDAERAREHLARAVDLDPGYSAAWKMYGKVLTDLGLKAEATDAYRRGIDAAAEKGDKQAQREMQVFLKRLQRDQ